MGAAQGPTLRQENDVATLADYVQILRSHGEVGVRDALSGPVLVESPFNIEAASTAPNRFQMSGLAMQEAVESVLRPDQREVHLLHKRQAGALSSHVTIGRTSDRDVHIARRDMSKFHAYLTREADGRLLLTDKGSTNGTWVGGTRLRPGEPAVLTDGCDVIFATRAYHFHTVTGMIDLLRELDRSH